MVTKIPASVRKAAKPALDAILELATKIPEEHRENYLGGVEQLVKVHAAPYIEDRLAEREPRGQTQTGEVYWVFDCEETPEEIRAALPKMAGYGGVNPNLETVLFEAIDDLPDDSNLREMVRSMEGHTGGEGELRIIHARMPEASNKDTGLELYKLINLAMNEDDMSPFSLITIGFNYEVLVKVGGEYFLYYDVDLYLPDSSPSRLTSPSVK